MKLRLASSILAILIALTFVPTSQARANLSLPDETELTNPGWARAGYSDLAIPFKTQTRYLLALDVDWPHGKISGQARILYTNNTPDALDKVEFRLYPNHPLPAAYGDAYTASKPRMIIQSVQVNSADVKWATRDKFQSVLAVPLPTALPKDAQATIDITYTVSYAPPTDSLDAREAFPLLAVYESGTWREDIVTKSLDFVFSETALFAVSLRTARDVALYATGSITNTAVDGDSVIYKVTTGPVRDFVFILTRGWGVIVGKTAPVLIDVRYKGSEAVAQEMTDIAMESMSYYDRTFGAYPYAHLTFLVLSYPTGGEEYPTLLYNDNVRDASYRRFIAAHEMAHQWFYGVAGNDIARHAWLDESLAQISLYLFYRDHYGTVVAEQEWKYILTWSTRQRGTPRPIDTAVEDFSDFSDYMTHTYGLGAVFLRDVLEKIGVDKFTAGLAAYYKIASFKVGTPQQFYEAIQAQTSDDLQPMFCKRMGFPCN